MKYGIAKYKELANSPVGDVFKRFSFTLVPTRDALFAIKSPVAFKIYENIEPGFDIYDIVNCKFGWNVSSLIIENLELSKITKYYDYTSKWAESLPGITYDNAVTFLATAEILEHEFPEILNGKLGNYLLNFTNIDRSVIQEIKGHLEGEERK